MTVLTEIKTIYPEFKFFKDFYTTLGKSETMFLSGDSSGITFNYPDDSFFAISAHVQTSSIFQKWLENKTVKLSLDNFQLLRKILKKSVKSIEYDDDTFRFNFTISDVDASVSFSRYTGCISTKFHKMTEKIPSVLEFDQEFLKQDILELHYSSGQISNKRFESSTKIIELPSKRLQALQKESRYYIGFSERDKNGFRTVLVKSQSESVRIEQVFLTI